MADTAPDERTRRLQGEAAEMFSLLEQAVPGGVGHSDWPRWRQRAARVLERVIGPTWLQQRIENGGNPAAPTAAAPAPHECVCVSLDTLRLLEANVAWLVAAARPHCTSEPESYGLADAEAAHAQLREILGRDPADSDGARGGIGVPPVVDPRRP